MNDTLIVKFNSEDFGEPILTIGRVDHLTEQIRLVASYKGELAVDVYNILTHDGSEEVEEKENA